jgi:hypothetical protein
MINASGGALQAVSDFDPVRVGKTRRHFTSPYSPETNVRHVALDELRSNPSYHNPSLTQ